MAKKYWLPSDNNGIADKLDNLAAKLSKYTTTFSLIAGQVSSVTADAAEFRAVVTYLNAARTGVQQLTAFKNALLRAPAGAPTGIQPLPTLPGAPALVTLVPFGILLRVTKLVAGLKKHVNMTPAIAEDLDIVGDDPGEIDLDNAKPVLKAKRRGDEVRIIWVKGVFHGVEIWVDRGNGVWVKLAVDMNPDYFDSETFPATATTWKYRARYIFNDEPVGLWSDVVEFLAKA